jgi:hypothetical protein
MWRRQDGKPVLIIGWDLGFTSVVRMLAGSGADVTNLVGTGTCVVVTPA